MLVIASALLESVALGSIPSTLTFAQIQIDPQLQWQTEQLIKALQHIEVTVHHDILGFAACCAVVFVFFLISKAARSHRK